MVRFKSSATVFVCAALFSGLASAAPPPGGPAISNGPTAAFQAAAPAALSGGTANHGHFACTAAINANGSVFSAAYVNPGQTMKLGTGTYQVGFGAPCADVRIVGGWYRVVQPDTLTFGTMPSRTCTVADRFGVQSALWVQCYDATGNLADTSFTLNVSR